MNRVFRGEERLSTERLLATLDFLDTSEADFFEGAFPREPVPRYSAGFLTDRREKVRTVPKVDFLPALRDWGTSLEIQPSGAEFSLAAQSFEQLLNADRATAFRMACAAIEAVLVLKPQVLSTESAGNLCRVLSPLSDLLRHQGDRNSACELLELAFRLEAQLEDFDLRSRLFRSASYLLCDLAYLDDARWFARRAVRLATLGGDQSSLGKSLYVEGVMVRRCGDGASEPLLKSSLRFLPQEAKSERAGVLVALASTKASEEAFSSARLDLAEASRILPSKKSTDWARVLMARADIAAKKVTGPKKGVTLQLLWEEYKAGHPEDGLQYSRFTDLYREYRGRLDLSMRQVHKAGEKLFVDYCGQTVPVRDPSSCLRRCQAPLAAGPGHD